MKELLSKIYAKPKAWVASIGKARNDIKTWFGKAGDLTKLWLEQTKNRIRATFKKKPDENGENNKEPMPQWAWISILIAIGCGVLFFVGALLLLFYLNGKSALGTTAIVLSCFAVVIVVVTIRYIYVIREESKPEVKESTKESAKDGKIKTWWEKVTEKHPTWNGVPTRALWIAVAMVLLELLLWELDFAGWKAVMSHKAFYALNGAFLVSLLLMKAVPDKAVLRLLYVVSGIVFAFTAYTFGQAQWRAITNTPPPLTQEEKEFFMTDLIVRNSEHERVDKGDAAKFNIDEIIGVTNIPILVKIDDDDEWVLYEPGSFSKPGPFSKLRGSTITMKCETASFVVYKRKM